MKRTTVLRKTTIPAFAGGASARTANQSSKERRIRSMATRSLVVAALALGISGVAQAANDCTLKTLNGLYVFTASGYNVVAGVAQPKAIVELINFNGDGTLSVPAATRSTRTELNMLSAMNRSPLGAARIARGLCGSVVTSSALKPAGTWGTAPAGIGTTCASP